MMTKENIGLKIVEGKAALEKQKKIFTDVSMPAFVDLFYIPTVIFFGYLSNNNSDLPKHG